MRRHSRGSRCARQPLSLETLESRHLLAGMQVPTQNPIDPMDVNDDQVVSAIDVLMLVDAMNRAPGQSQVDVGYLDVNGDGAISAVDVLQIVDRLNRPSRPPSDPPHGDGGQPQPPASPDEIRSLDGTGNNLNNTDWGSTDSELLREASVDYGDGVSTLAGADRPSPREISNQVSAQSETTVNERGLTDLVWQWGQFLDHDIDLTHTADPAEAADIAVPAGDPFFDPAATGQATIGFNRSIYDPQTGSAADNPRQQTNQITAFLDGSNVYGSSAERAAALRTFVGGRLDTSSGDLLPLNTSGLDNAGGPTSALFLAGDERANEQAGLIAMHTLWVREHNRIAAAIESDDPSLSDEQIYQQARAIVIAEMQAITFNEFLPALLGERAIPQYTGYDPTVNPSISNVFSTAAYRFGHSMLSPTLLRIDENGEVIDAGNLPLAEAFFNTAAITEHGIDSLLRGLASQQAQEIDSFLVDDVRNFLFGPPGAGGFDLASLNIQRGRDHGLADYNAYRVAFGLDPVSSFADITSDPAIQAALATAYGDVNNIDVWVGGLAEDHVGGGSLGELNRAILIDQFTRIRDGDRFWYQNTLSGEQLREIERTTLADVMQRNTTIRGLQSNVFFSSAAQPDHGHGGHHHDHPGSGQGHHQGSGGRDRMPRSTEAQLPEAQLPETLPAESQPPAVVAPPASITGEGPSAKTVPAASAEQRSQLLAEPFVSDPHDQFFALLGTDPLGG